MKKKILWILHHPWETIEGQREYFLIHLLKNKMDIHVVTWSHNKDQSKIRFLNPLYYLKTLRFKKELEGSITTHHIPVLPNVSNYIATNKLHSFFPNRVVYKSFLKYIMKKESFDYLICGTNHWLFGHLPKNISIPVIFDYLDSYPDVLLEKICKYSDGVFSVSNYLREQAEKFHKRVFYSPNGIQSERFVNLPSKENAKKQLNLEGQFVISLIGLTCSPNFYFIDAIKLFQKEHTNTVFLFVGGGKFGETIENYCVEKGVAFVHPGRVPHDEIQVYFSATDIGLYPGELTPVYDGACPLKVLEYSATHRPVVSSFSKELEKINLPNIHLANIEPVDFYHALKKAKDYDGPYSDLERFYWENIAETFQRDLLSINC